MIANEQRYVPLLQKTLDVDECFVVDDEVFAQYVWPSDVFELVTDPTTNKEK